MNIKKISLGFSIIGLSLLTSLNAQAKTIHILDSIGVENKDGKEIVIHRLVAKESYYSLARLYKVKPKDIITLNANKHLKIGDLVKIPTNRVFQTLPEKTVDLVNEDPEFIEYKVSANETLYTIAKRFQVSVDYIAEFNDFKGESIKAGQIIRIPQGQHPQKPTTELVVTEEAEKEFSLPPNQYGLTQINNQGIGVWMEGLNTDDGKMLALHKTAPIGTVIKITNPMTQRTTYAKVVGKYNDSNDTRDAIIVISKATASLIGIIDKRFLVNISYGVTNKEY